MRFRVFTYRKYKTYSSDFSRIVGSHRPAIQPSRKRVREISPLNDWFRNVRNITGILGGEYQVIFGTTGEKSPLRLSMPQKVFVSAKPFTRVCRIGPNL